MLEKIFAASVVAACALMLLRVLVGPRRRSRLDASLRRLSARIGRFLDAVFARPNAARRAEREAKAAIRRAQGRAAGHWDGNVYKPKSFRKRRDIH
ncbi:MAG: hypothetical protein ABI641_04805 [Caldimonas sp.]